MSDPIDPIMQAAERCEGMFDVTSIDFENMPVEAIKDLYAMAGYLRRILPKGKRPVAIEGEDWEVADLLTGKHYASDSDCDLARHWERLDELMKAVAAR